MLLLDEASIRDYQWLFLDLNSYFASVEQQICPELRGKPIAVIPLETEATCAIAASYEAKRFGVKTGTKVYDAKKLCPDIIFVLADHERYVDYHHRIMTELDRHLPIESIESIDEAACRLIGPQCTRDHAIPIAQQIKQGLKDNVGEYIRCSIGIAPNKYLAKVATELEKPDGLVVLEKADLPGKLLELELNDLTGIGRGMSSRLFQSGIHTVEELWNLSPKHMKHIWGGIGGERFWYLLHGHDLPDRDTKRRTVGHSHMLSPEWRPADQAYIVAQRLTLKAASRLRRLGFYATHMDMSIRIEHGNRLHTDKRFHRCCDNLTLKTIMHQCWQMLMGRANLPANKLRIKKISVTLSGLVPLHQVQPELFDQPHEQDALKKYESVSSAMDKLNAKYGRDTVVMGFLPKRSHSFSGTKIAFSRIPDQQEFHE